MIKYPDKKKRELTDKEKEMIKQKIRIGVPTQRIAEEFNCAQTQVAALEAHLTMSGVGVRKFWKFSVGRGRWGNDSAIENGIIVIWGWDGVVDFDMKRFNKNGDTRTFQTNIKEHFQTEDQKSQGEYPGYKQLTDFYFLNIGDIIFLYGKKPFTIDAIGVVEKEYFYNPKHYMKIFRGDYKKIEDDDARQSHLVGVKWLHTKPILIQCEDLKKKMSRTATIIELTKEEAFRLFKHAGIDSAEYLRSNEMIEPSEVEIKEAEEIENILTKTQIKDTEVLEGGGEYREVLWRYRNRGIINEKKSNSDYTCEICEFNFSGVYGAIGNEYIVIHHLDPIGSREHATMTRLEDLALVCDNCHRMLHRKSPPYTPEELKKFMTLHANKPVNISEVQ